jgi:membrane-associated phospholipid phosphatase
MTLMFRLVDRRRLLRVGAPAAWALGTIALIVLWGIPTKHDLIFLWLGVGMAAFSLEASRVVRDWLPLVGIMFVYDLLRGVADGLAFPVRETPQIRVETALFGKPAPTVWLQEHFWHGPNHLHWWDYAAWFLHLTHFFATFVAAAVIWVVAREHFARYSAMICVLALTGFATYVLYPAAPPWMAAQDGNLGESNRMIAPIWHHIPVTNAGAVFEHGQGYANDVAAMPSLHAAFALLLSLYLWRLVPRWWRPLLALYPIAMSLALVYAGEHYVVDCIAGWVYAVAAFLGVNWAFAWRARRRPALEPALAD